MVVCRWTGAGRCLRGAGRFRSSEYFVEGFGRSVADRSWRRRGADVCCVSAVQGFSFSGSVKSCCEMCAGVGSTDVGKLIVVLPFDGAESPSISGNVGSLITIPVGETVGSSWVRVAILKKCLRLRHGDGRCIISIGVGIDAAQTMESAMQRETKVMRVRLTPTARV